MLRANFEQLFYICLFVKPLTCDQPFVIIIIIFIIIIYFWEEREKESLPSHEGNIKTYGEWFQAIKLHGLLCLPDSWEMEDTFISLTKRVNVKVFQSDNFFFTRPFSLQRTPVVGLKQLALLLGYKPCLTMTVIGYNYRAQCTN